MAKLTNEHRRRIAAETREQLVAAFPNCFCGKGQPKRPLKIGIREDVRAALPGIPKAGVYLALTDYTAGPTYKRAIIAGAARIDLEGNPSGEVTEAEAQHAAQALATMLGEPAA